MKPTRTDDNKASKSSPIRKGSIPQEEIKKIAKELTKVSEVIQEVQAPAIEVVCGANINDKFDLILPIMSNSTPGNYEAYAAALQAIIDENETVTVSKQALLSIFPQCKHAKNIAQNLKRTYGINYRYSDLGEYVFFDGETKDEIIERLNEEKDNWETTARKLSDKCTDWYNSWIKLHNEKHDLESDLYNTQGQRNQSLLLAILLFIYILISNYYG